MPSKALVLLLLVLTLSQCISGRRLKSHKKYCKCDSSSSSESRELCDDKVPVTPKCPVNEVFSYCPPACFGDGCFAFVYAKRCYQECDSEPRCICKCGYLRNDQGICVPKKDCGNAFPNKSYEEFCSKYYFLFEHIISNLTLF